MLLEIRGATKKFGQVEALREVDFDVEAGEVHALVGENGAGKSTLMKILAGAYTPDGGRIRLRGQDVRIGSVAEAQSLGITMVYQELTLVPDMSVAENLFLGRMDPFVSHSSMNESASALLADIGLDVDPRVPVRSLRLAEQQLIEIARGFAREGSVLILDEPTAALSSSEADRLFELIRHVGKSDVGIVYISHRLEEVFRIAQRVTVLRDGKRIGTNRVTDLGPQDIVRLMVGREVRAHERHPTYREEIAGHFSFEGLGVQRTELTLREGEIVGLAGVVGSGRSRVLSILFGLDGVATWQGIGIGAPGEAIRRGMALVPADRKSQGLAPELSVQHNLVLASLKSLSRFGVMRLAAERREARRWVERLNVRPPSLGKPVRELSGGNQQKVVVGKGLATAPRVLLMDEPTRGVDVGARSELYAVIDQLAQSGLALLISSSDSEELVALCDRILVFRGGRVVSELASPMTYEEVVTHVTGAALSA